MTCALRINVSSEKEFIIALTLELCHLIFQDTVGCGAGVERSFHDQD